MFTKEGIAIVRHVAPEIIQSYEAKERAVINRLLGEFKAGNTDKLLSITAELSAVRDLHNDFKRALAQETE